MHIYIITFLGGETYTNFRAKSIREAYELAAKIYKKPVVNIKLLR